MDKVKWTVRKSKELIKDLSLNDAGYAQKHQIELANVASFRIAHIKDSLANMIDVLTDGEDVEEADGCKDGE